MKHLLSVLLISLVALSAKAQIFAGANAGVAYSNEVFSMTAEPYIGYEFNDKVAAGTGVGIEVFEEKPLLYSILSLDLHHGKMR